MCSTGINMHEMYRIKTLSFGVQFTLSRNVDVKIKFSFSLFVSFGSLYFLLKLFIDLIFFHHVGWRMLFSIFHFKVNHAKLRYEYLIQLKCSHHIPSSVHLIESGRVHCSVHYFHFPSSVQVKICPNGYSEYNTVKFIHFFVLHLLVHLFWSVQGVMSINICVCSPWLRTCVILSHWYFRVEMFVLNQLMFVFSWVSVTHISQVAFIPGDRNQ